MHNDKITGIQHVSFDFWITLIRTHPEFKRERAALFCRFFSVTDVEATEKVIRKVDLMANHINDLTGGNLQPLELYLLVLQEVHPDWKSISLQDLETFYTATGKLFGAYMPLPVDDTVELALNMLLERGITMNILSNTGFIKGHILRKSLEQLGWTNFFSFTVFSDETGHSKPHHAMFEKVWEDVKKRGELLNKPDVLHLGDNPVADIEGAKKFGFSSALFLPGKGTFYQQLSKAINPNG